MPPSRDPELLPRARLRYASTVEAVGQLIPDFRAQGLLIFFGESAPPELHQLVIRHRPTVADSAPRPGDAIELDGEPFLVTAVGEAAAVNLLTLGHIALKADGSSTAPLPGDVCVERRELPALRPGSSLRILANADDDPDSPRCGVPGPV
jgi:glucitol/sorbitol PTS system EIIA component